MNFKHRFAYTIGNATKQKIMKDFLLLFRGGLNFATATPEQMQ